MSKEIKPHIAKKLELIKQTTSRIENLESFKAKGVSVRETHKVIAIASTIAFRCLDCTLDDHGSLFYSTTQDALTSEILFELNEDMVIDIDAINELVRPLWLYRHRIATGATFGAMDNEDLFSVLTTPKATLVRQYLEMLRG